jgi:hypothetical protein
MLRAAVIVLLIALLPSPLRAEAHIALLVGNEAYAAEIAMMVPHGRRQACPIQRDDILRPHEPAATYKNGATSEAAAAN